MRHYKKHVPIERLGHTVRENSNSQGRALVRATERTLNHIPGIAQREGLLPPGSGRIVHISHGHIFL
jgi:hypothetical protein